MKKFLKFLFGTCTLAAAILGVYYVVKNIMNKDEVEDDFDDLDDDFDEFETDTETTTSESREYVPINLSGSETEAEETAQEETTESSEDTEPATEE